MQYLWLRQNPLKIPIKLFRRDILTSTMANSKFEDAKKFERENFLTPNTWIVVRIDGKNFSRFCDSHQFVKPNDVRALNLMNEAAKTVLEEFKEIILAFGQSDEYSFVFGKETELYNRRESKLVSYVNSLFTSAYVFNWSQYFQNVPLKYPPSFDARAVIYPSNEDLRKYLSWRQADVHINNLYNTCFWNLVLHKNMTCSEAQIRLKGSLSSDKNELLFKEFGINYNKEPLMFRKGTTLIKKLLPDGDGKTKLSVLQIHDDIIGDKFWNENSELLAKKQSTTSLNKLKKLQRLNIHDNKTSSVKVNIASEH
ncbi:hypothetical protein PV326_002796 [Microctonus aethiopoides]|nr:hypothetical protein PV326_002796 [Microctonus aethiopoides]